MGSWVALLRGVNVGGNNKLPMETLRALAEGEGFGAVRSYIASGNLVFESDLGEAEIREKLETAIEREYGKRLGVIVRSGADMAAALARNPFPDMPGNKVVTIFTDGEVSAEGLRHQVDEEVIAGKREIFAWYPSGQGLSKLVIPGGKDGTARNMNTVAKLAEMAAEAG
jgi:uncharacterized protein (DUF1697 family)